MLRTPSISTVSWVYWPALKPVQFPLGRRVTVTLRGVVRATAITLARTSVDDQEGRTSST